MQFHGNNIIFSSTIQSMPLVIVFRGNSCKERKFTLIETTWNVNPINKQLIVSDGCRILERTYHCKNRTRTEEFTKAIEKWSFFQIIIMFLSKFLWWNNQLDCNKFVTLAFKTGDNFWNLQYEMVGINS